MHLSGRVPALYRASPPPGQRHREAATNQSHTHRAGSKKTSHPGNAAGPGLTRDTASIAEMQEESAACQWTVIGRRTAMTGWSGSVRPLRLQFAVRLESFDRGEQPAGVGRVAEEEVSLVLRL